MLDDKVWGLDHIQKKTDFLEETTSSNRKKIDYNKKANNKKVVLGFIFSIKIYSNFIYSD